jgi:hypothetical protein
MRLWRNNFRNLDKIEKLLGASNIKFIIDINLRAIREILNLLLNKLMLKKIFYTITITTIITFINAAYAFEDNPFAQNNECPVCDKQMDSTYDIDTDVDHKTKLTHLYRIVEEILNPDTDMHCHKTKLNSLYRISEKIVIGVNQGHIDINHLDYQIPKDHLNNLIDALKEVLSGSKKEIDDPNKPINTFKIALGKILSYFEEIEKKEEAKRKEIERKNKNRETLMERYSKYCDPNVKTDENFDTIKECIERDRSFFEHHYHTLGRHSHLFDSEILGPEECKQIREAIKGILSTIEIRSSWLYIPDSFIYRIFHIIDDCDESYDEVDPVVIVTSIIVIQVAIALSISYMVLKEPQTTPPNVPPANVRPAIHTGYTGQKRTINQ